MIEQFFQKIKFLMVSLFLSGLVGCAATNSDLYYWGNYSNTLYAYTKEPSAKTLDAHKKELLSIVTVSDKSRKRVPPGIYAELGHLALAQGNEASAKNYFQHELAVYPESEKVIAIELQKRAK